MRSLFRRKGRRSTGLYPIEGVRHVAEILNASHDPEFILYEPGVSQRPDGAQLLAKLKERYGSVLHEIDPLLRSEVTDTETPQGICAAVPVWTMDLGVIFQRPSPQIVVCWGVQDPGNLGTIIRTLEAFGGDALLTLPGTVDPYLAKTVRASAGAVLHLPTLRCESWEAVAGALSAVELPVVATEPGGGVRPREVDWDDGYVLLVGGEGSGLPEQAKEAAGVTVQIPMVGHLQSLNAAMAAAMILYEANR